MTPDDLPEPWGYDLWKLMRDEHGLTLLESELHEIVRIAQTVVERDMQSGAPTGAGVKLKFDAGDGSGVTGNVLFCRLPVPMSVFPALGDFVEGAYGKEACYVAEDPPGWMKVWRDAK